MTSGLRTERIAVEREGRTGDGMGGAPGVWSVTAEMWAEVQWIGGGETDDRGAVRATAKYRFRVLSEAAGAADVRPADRIRWNGEVYNIRERPRRLPREPLTDIIAETGVTQ